MQPREEVRVDERGVSGCMQPRVPVYARIDNHGVGRFHVIFMRLGKVGVEAVSFDALAPNIGKALCIANFTMHSAILPYDGS